MSDIDTDKYEGHTEGPWMVCCEDQKSPHPPRWIQADEKSVCSDLNDATEVDAQLIADAPLLLEEVKRWHKVYQCIHHLYSSNQKTVPLYELMELIEEEVMKND